MKKYFLNFLKAFCAYDEFLKSFNLAYKGDMDFDYFLTYTEPELYIVGAFSSNNSLFSKNELSTLYHSWNKRLNQLNDVDL